MASSTPGSSRDIKKSTGFIPKTAPEKLRILRRVAAKVSEEIIGTVRTRPKSVEFTGLDMNFNMQLGKKSADHIDITVREIDRSVIYDTLMNLYLHERMMPTTYQLYVKLSGIIPAHMDLGEFRNYIFKHGFMWKQIVKGACVVIENPKITFERYSYLKNILRHRKEGKTIYFIDEVAFDFKGDILTIKESISRKAEPQIRLIYAVTNEGVQFKQYVNEFSTAAILKWIKELLRTVSSPSVFVLNNYKHHCEELLTLPNEDSLKSEMCDWLEYFDVPHDPELPKAVLFELVQKYTDLSKKIYVLDNMLEQRGHTVLRLPDCIIKLTPATYYFDILRVNMPDLLGGQIIDRDAITTSINQIIDALNEEHGRECDSVIEVEEQVIFLKDQEVDTIMDELELSMSKAFLEHHAIDSDLPSNDSDSE